MTGKEKALFLAYPILWTFSVVSFWCFGSASDSLGFTLLHLYLLHPPRSSASRPRRLGKLCPSGRFGFSQSRWRRATCSATFSPFVSPIWPPFRTGRRPNGSCCRSVWRSRLRDSFSGESFAVLSLEKTERQSTARAWMSASYPAEPVDFLFYSFLMRRILILRHA